MCNCWLVGNGLEIDEFCVVVRDLRREKRDEIYHDEGGDAVTSSCT